MLELGKTENCHFFLH